MVANLTQNERILALLCFFALCCVGLVFAAVGRGDPIAGHGWLMMAFGGGGAILVLRALTAPEPGPERLAEYYDDPTKVGIILTLLWAVVGMGVGAWVAFLLAFPDLNFEVPWTSFGRIRPVHTSGVIFGFGGNALIATSLHVLQRTSRARLPDQFSPWFVLVGYNLFCVLAASGYMMGITQSKEYAEPEWYADILLVVVWVVYFLIYVRTLQRRKEPHIYVANWYYMAFILVVAMLHIVNNIAVPVSFLGAKSYSIFSGVQDAMTQWWYGHNAVAFFLTAGFLRKPAGHWDIADEMARSETTACRKRRRAGGARTLRALDQASVSRAAYISAISIRAREERGIRIRFPHFKQSRVTIRV